MSPDLAFWLALALKMAVTAGFVVAASIVAEKSGPAIGAMIATLPIAAAPSYVFLALDHDTAFIARSALGSLSANAVTGIFSLIYVVLAQRQSLVVSLAAALAVWFALAFALSAVGWNIVTVVAFNVAVFAVCIPLVMRYCHVAMPRVMRRWYDMPLRAAMVACLVAIVVGTSTKVGPSVTGLLAVFPIVLTSLMLIFQPRIGGPATAALLGEHHVGPGRLLHRAGGALPRGARVRHLDRLRAVARDLDRLEFRGLVGAPPYRTARWSMIPKSGDRFSDKIMLKQKR